MALSLLILGQNRKNYKSLFSSLDTVGWNGQQIIARYCPFKAKSHLNAEKHTCKWHTRTKNYSFGERGCEKATRCHERQVLKFVYRMSWFVGTDHGLENLLDRS